MGSSQSRPRRTPLSFAREHILLVLVMAIAVLAVLAVPPTAYGATAGPSTPAPPSMATPVSHPPSTRFVELKLREGASLQLRGQRFVTPRGVPASGLNRALANAGVRATEPLFVQPATELQGNAKQLRQSGHPVPDLSQWYRLRLPSRASAADAVATLSGLDAVVEVYVAPAPPPPPEVSPNLESYQQYRSPAPTGIGDTAVGSVPGSDGSAVKIIDIEYSWNLEHEDLSAARNALIPNGTPCDPFNSTDHGTAVLGVLAADDNGFGVTGIVPGAEIGVTNAAADGCSWAPASAISVATAALSPGDIILLEQQAYGPTNQLGPVEVVPSVYDAIKTATASGIIVVEAAGNGSANLDDPAFGTSFPDGKPDSGAIIVGAALACSAGNGSRASFSTYGSRVNLHGWGECVTTTGYGYISGTEPNNYYTTGFNGTSSASPIVAGAAAAVLSAAEVSTGTPLSPDELRSLLVDTGTPQVFGPDVLTGNIGPMPDLEAALATDFRPGTPQNLAAAGTNQGITLTWDVGPDTDLAGFNVYRSSRPSESTFKKIATIPATTTSYLDTKADPGVTTYYRLEAVDLADQLSGGTTAQAIRTGPGVQQQGAATYSGAWRTTSCPCFSGGSTKYSTDPRATARFRFTGSGITFVSERADDRGAVKIYLDGRYRTTVDLGGAHQLNAFAAWSKKFTTSREHILKLVVVGTAGRPGVDVDAFVVRR